MELSRAPSPRPESVCVDGEAGEEGYFLMLIDHEANPPLRSAGAGGVDSSISWYCNINAHSEDKVVVYHIHDLLHTPLTHTYVCA